MADRARLDGMTPEVLEGLASWCDLFPGDSTVGDAFANLAALCRAVSRAERTIASVAERNAPVTAHEWFENAAEMTDGAIWHDATLTLAAALGAVTEEKE